MRALRYDDYLHLAQHEPPPQPAAEEALINLRLAGICQTDLELTRGYMGFNGILGHEFVGEIAEDTPKFRRGTRVVGEINVACGRCDYCNEGIPSQCRNRTTLGIDRYPGVFADQLRLPLENLYAVPDSVPDHVAVFAEPLAAACEIQAQVRISPSDRVVVIGAGKLGLLSAQVLKLTGCDLSVVARQDRPKELLKQWEIPVIDGRNPDVRLRNSAHIVVDCSGTAEGFAAALDMVRPRGTLVLKSTYAASPQADLSHIVIDEITVVGSRCGPFSAALRLMQANLVDVTSMIEVTYSLDDALAAFEHAAKPGALKVLLRP